MTEISYSVKISLRYLTAFNVIVIAFFIAFFGSTTVFVTQALTIEPNHDKPCVIGDAWAEECMSCVCSEGRIATCKPSFCATRLRRDLDDCKEGEVTKVDCNTCKCKNNVKVCTKYDCDKDGNIRRTRKSKKEKRMKRLQEKT